MFESLRDMYLEREHLFSVSRPADLEIERKVREELEERNKELQDMLREIRASNRELRIDNKELNMRMSKMELTMTDFEKKINEIRELLPRRTKDEQSN